jgi:small conductance mechanosensitive channel
LKKFVKAHCGKHSNKPAGLILRNCGKPEANVMNRVEHFYDKVYTWILTVGPRLLLALAVLVVGLWLIGVFKRWLGRVLAQRELAPSIKPFLQGTIATVLQLLLFFALLQILGVEMTVFAAVIGSFGVAAGFALSGTLQNFASGVLILLLKPYVVGDKIITQGQEGTVTAIQLFYTTVLTLDNKTVIVPNSKLSNEIIINLSRQGTRRLDVNLKFNYGYDFEKLKSIMVATVTEMKAILPVPEYRIGITTLESDGFTASVQVWTAADGFEDTKLVLHQKLVDDLKSSGIQLAGMPAPGAT